jgi:hypothetical protein
MTKTQKAKREPQTWDTKRPMRLKLYTTLTELTGCHEESEKRGKQVTISRRLLGKLAKDHSNMYALLQDLGCGFQEKR